MSRFVRGAAALIALAIITPQAGAQEMLSNLQIVGTVERTGTAPTFKSGDEIKVIEDKGGAIAATGSVVDGGGTFFVEMSKPAKYNGTPLSLAIVVNGETLPLKEGKAEAKLVYKGTFPFPKRETRTLYYGSGTPPATAAKAATICPASLPKCDANGDGRFDRKDIDFVKAQLTAKTPDPRADLNGDGVVNSADVVAGTRALDGK